MRRKEQKLDIADAKTGQPGHVEEETASKHSRENKKRKECRHIPE